MEHAGASAALEPFLALSKSATGPRAAADLVTRATSDPNTFFFAELLHTPPIQALASTDHAPLLRLLQIFSHGLYESYVADPSLPALNPAQALKLRQLSLVSLASDRSNLSYAALQHRLGLTSPREVEELAVTAIHAGLIHATLDPARQCVRVTRILPVRDPAPGAVPAMAAALRGWAGRCASTLTDLESQMAGIYEAAAARERDRRVRDERMEQLLAEAREADKRHARETLARRGGGLNKRPIIETGKAGAEDSMDIDEPHISDEKGKRASKRKM